jgi:hypothetical protein
MLSDMKSVVGCVEDVGIFECTSLVQSLNNTFYQLINALQSAESLPIEVIVVGNIARVLFWKLLHPACTTWLRHSF